MKHHSDDFDSVAIEHDGSVLIEPQDDGACVVRFQVPDNHRDRENLIASFRHAQDILWRKTAPSASTRKDPPSTICRECKEPLGQHLTRGARVLECPNRCPGCDDQAVYSAQVDSLEAPGGVADAAVWLMDFSDSKDGAAPTEVDFCPFCGLDLRGAWLYGRDS